MFTRDFLVFISAAKSSPHIKTCEIPAVGEKPHESIKVSERSKQPTTAFLRLDLTRF